MKIITEPAQPVTALRKSVPANVSAALARALEKLPADRFESARRFQEALTNAAYASPATAAATAIAVGERRRCQARQGARARGPQDSALGAEP